MNRRARIVDALAIVAIVRLIAPWAAPGAQPADAGELQLVARHLGVAHPPGYPLYTLAAHGFGRVASQPLVARLLGVDCADVALDGVTCAPWALWPWAVSLFGALLAAATLVVVFHAGRRLGGGVAAGLAGAAALAAAPTFVAQATVAGIRMPTALLTAAVLALALGWLHATAPHNDRALQATKGLGGPGHLAALAFAFALAAGHHPTLAFLALPLAAVVLLRRPGFVRDPGAIAGVGVAAALGLLPLAYLPLRAGALLAPPDLGTWRGLWHHVSAAGFRGDVFYFDDARTLLDRLAVLGDLVVLQFGPLGLALAAVGAAWLAMRRPLSGALLVATTGLLAALSITYRAPQTVEYLMPAYVALALLVAAGAGAGQAIAVAVVTYAQPGHAASEPRDAGARARMAERAGTAVALALVLAPLWRGRDVPAGIAATAPRMASMLDRTLGCLGSDGQILASWHYATPLWVAALARAPHAAELPDAIDYVAPDFATGDPIGVTWRKRVAAAAARQPIVVTNRPAELIADQALLPVPGTPFYAVPLAIRSAADGSGAVMTCVEPPTSNGSPAEATWSFSVPGRDDDAVRLVASDVGDRQPGGATTVTLWFAPRTANVPEPLTAVVQLVDPATGAVHGQWDRSIPAAWTSPGGPSVRAELVPFDGAPRAALAVVAGIYRTTANGPERLMAMAPDGPLEAVPIGAVDLAEVAPPRPRGPGTVPFGADLVLAGSRVAFDGRQAVVDLIWRAGLVGRSDATVSVHVTGDGWTRQHDGTPALGALPTLKWLPGWRVPDRHRIDLAGVEGPRAVSVGVYDAFSLEPLPVTDAERVRRGEGQRAVIWVAEDGDAAERP